MALRPRRVILLSYAKQTLHETSREAARMRHYATMVDELHVIIFTRVGDNLPTLVAYDNVRVYGTQAHTRFGMVVRAYELVRQITRHKPHEWLVSAQDPFVPAWIAKLLAWRSGLTDHIQLHGEVLTPTTDPTWRGAIFRLLGWWCVKRVLQIRVVSERLKSKLVQGGVPANRIAVLPIQADVSQFFTVGAAHDPSTHRETTFLYVGRFAPEKNLPLLLRAFAHVVKAESGCRLILCGDGPERTVLQLLCETLEVGTYVSFIPWTHDVASVMAAADVICLSSNHEGWGMVLVEAMAIGRPVITTDVGCAGELVRDGSEGWVVPVGDQTAYAEALREALLDPHERVRRGMVARRTATQFVMTPADYLQAWYESLGYLRD